LVLLGDPDDRSPLPTTLGGEAVVASDATLVCRIQHAVDGEATAAASLGTNDDASGMVLVHEGLLALPSGRLRLGDAANEAAEETQLAPGRYGVCVFVDELEHPTQVIFALSR
jgi:hypothetical protein